jgi:hypothetical protein
MRTYLVAALLRAAACSPTPNVPAPGVGQANSAFVYPAGNWEPIGSPESAGWSSARLAELRQKLSTLSTTGMMAVVGGRVLFEYGDVQRVSYLASVRKSVLSMLYGIYQARGMVQLAASLEEPGIDDVGGLCSQ